MSEGVFSLIYGSFYLCILDRFVEKRMETTYYFLVSWRPRGSKIDKMLHFNLTMSASNLPFRLDAARESMTPDHATLYVKASLIETLYYYITPTVPRITYSTWSTVTHAFGRRET